MQTPCSIQLFGGLRVQQGDRTITRFRTQKTALLLGYLACHAGRMHPREVLIELLWPDREPDAGRNSLSTALSSLRNQLEPPGASRGSVIRADRQAVGLNADAVTVDVVEFEAGLRAAAGLKRGLRRTQLLADSVDLYRGEFLSGHYDDWVILEQRRLAELCCRAVAEVTDGLEHQGDLEGALRYAWLAVSIDPVREEAHRRVMRLYALAGQPELAIRQYHELEKTLVRELQTSPSEDTLRLCRAIERGTLLPRPRTAERLPAAADPSALPPGTITFVLASRDADVAAAGSLSVALLNQLARRYGGTVTDSGEGGFTAAFGCANDALACVLAMQASLAGEWRFALDTGQAEVRDGRYCSPAVSYAGRLLLAAHPEQVLCSGRTAALVQADPNPGVRLVDLGLYRFRTEAGAERVFQAEPSSAPTRRLPALNAPRARTGNLPAPLTRFIGREGEVAEIQRLICEEGNRLVTLTGAPGSGKTRLAVETAHRLVESFPGGMWFVSAADLAAGDALPAAIRDALRVPGPLYADPFHEVAEALRGDPALLLLDNLEHLAPEAARVVQSLLERVPRLVCLCTSRRRLQVPGERELVVGPLGTPGEEEDPARVVASDSVCLFLDRAQAAQPDFQVTRGNAAAVAALCTRLEGLPLALEIAAARARVLTPKQMLERLATGETTFSTRAVATHRHSSVQAAIGWSYEMLSPQLRRFFDQLSVFRGGCTAAAAEAICQEPCALDLLGQLRGLSLLQTEVQHPETRFRMLETLRAYATDHLTGADRAELGRRHAAYYVRLAETGLSELFRPAQAEWLDRLAPEQDNLRAAIEWGLGSDGDAEMAARLVAAAWPLWYARARIQEGRQWIARVLAVVPPPGGALRGRLLAGGGTLALNAGDVDAAARLSRDALPLCREAEDHWGTALALNILGMGARGTSDLEQAEALHREALRTAHAAGDAWGAALALCGLADCAIGRKEHRQAVAQATDALKLARASRDRWLAAWALGTRGLALMGCGDRARADALCRESLALFLDMGDLIGAYACLEALAQICGAGLGLAKAARLLGAAHALRERVGSAPLPEEEKQIKRGVALLRTLLGKGRFQREWDRGRRTALPDMLALATDEENAPSG